jgi:uncharacterized protein
MIVDCHTQIWESVAQLGRAGRAPLSGFVRADTMCHLEAVDPVDRAIVLAFKSCYLDAEIPNRYVSDYVRRYSNKLIGFAGIDPTEDHWAAELRKAQEELQLKGVTLSPGMQNFHPLDTRAMALYAECQRRGMPILIQQDHRNVAAKLEFSRPLLLDQVAQEFPELRIVVSHLGYPWVDETVVLLGKHPHVYADIAGLLRQPWRAYNALLAAFEYGVMPKLLFGSDFPFRSPAGCIEALYSVNQVSHGTNLVAIPREQLRGIVERDALKLLGIEQSTALPNRSKTTILTDDE